MEEWLIDESFFNEYDVWNYSNNSECSTQNKANVLFGSYIIFITIFGLIGNFLVFSSITILKEYKTSSTNWYIMQLALANSLFLIMLSFSADSHIRGMWNFSLPLCKFKEAMLFINYYASIYFLVVMSFDRFLAITKAYSCKRWLEIWRSPATSYMVSAFGWIMSVVSCIQLFKYSTISHCNLCAYEFPLDENQDSLVSADYLMESVINDDNFSYGGDLLQDLFNKFVELNDTSEELFDYESECKLPESTTLRFWIFGNFVGAFCFPFLLICFFYGAILIKVQRSPSTESKKKQRSTKRRAAIVVLCLVGLFAVSWLPWYVVKMAQSFGLPLTKDNCLLLETVVRALAYLNSALNPYIFSFFGTNFRTRITKVKAKLGFGMQIRSPTPNGVAEFCRNNNKCISVVEQKCLEKKQIPFCFQYTGSVGGFTGKTSITERTIV